MDFKKYLRSAALEIEREEQRILRNELKAAEKKDKKLLTFINLFIKSSRGGKRIRGALVKIGYETATGKSKEIIKIAAAFEIMHTAILAHDDIMDQSLIRRSKPSLYAALGGNHNGISQAITLGDWGFFLAFKIITESIFPAERKFLALKFFSDTMMDTALGQMLDVQGERSYLVMKLKTACYTIAGPLQMGAILAGADNKLVRLLGEFGENLGIAYQIRDDVLDHETRDGQKTQKEAAGYLKKAWRILPKVHTMSKLLESMAKYLIERTK